MRFDVVTLFPQMIVEAVRYGVTGTAIVNGTVDLKIWNPRDYASNRHRTVDDRPYGGGPGMVMKYQPLRDAIHAAKADAKQSAKVIYVSPQGRQLTQNSVEAFASNQRLILIAGRYEGIDERVCDAEVDEEWSIGDYILSGGELAALVVIDAVTRLLPNVLGNDESHLQDSYVNGILDYPHYTRPLIIDEMKVPDILQNGNHAEIGRWRKKQALGRTWQRRPDLLERCLLDYEQTVLLDEFKKEQNAN